MKIRVSWHINNWTNQGPGSISVWCEASPEGFQGYDERPGLHTNSGARFLFNTFEQFMELLTLAQDSVRRIKESKAKSDSPYSWLRESVSVVGITEIQRTGYTDTEHTTFYDYGSTSPRHGFANVNKPGNLLAALINQYIENDDAPPIAAIHDQLVDLS